MSSNPWIVAVVGPTASNKSNLALQIAQHFHAEIVNADAFKIYRGFDIGTAKPTDDDRNQIKHHLLDILDPVDSYNVARFINDASEAIQDIHSRQKLPILVGGTGQYIRALTEGWQIPKIPAKLEMRLELEAELARDGLHSLVAKLEHLNPIAASTTDIKNPRRVIRALERTLCAPDRAIPNQSVKPAFKTLFVGINVERAKLHSLVEQRIRRMFDLGWIKEVETIISQGVTKDAPAMAAIGYRDILQHIAGVIDFETVIEHIQIKTNKLIRHQNNWFKATDSNINWVSYDNINATMKLIKQISNYQKSN